MPEQKQITIYLTEWQKRMVADHVATDHLKGLTVVSKIRIAKKIPPAELVMYRVNPDIGHGWNLYLTDEQIRHVSEELGIKAKISALNVSKKLLDSGTVIFA